MLKGLQARLGLVFAAFVILVLISTGAMVWGLEVQKQDAMLIELAGRQRMLSQQMARLAFEAGMDQVHTNQALQEAESTFAATLQAMLHGGPVPYLPDETVFLQGTRSPQIRSELEKLGLSWSEYRLLLDELQATSRSDPRFGVLLHSIGDAVPGLESHSHTIVHLYERQSVAKLVRLRELQLGFLAAALVLLGLGALVTRRSVLKPLTALAISAERLGQSDLDTPVNVDGPQEIQALSASFNGMRKRLRSMRTELLDLTSALETRVNQRTRELNALHEVSHEITSQLDVGQVLRSVTDKVRDLLGGDSAMLCLLDDAREYLHLKAVSGQPLIPIYENYMSTVNYASQALTSRHALMCTRAECVGGCGFFSSEHAPSHIVAPLRIGDKVIGALCVSSARPDRFTHESTELLTRLSSTAAIALQNAQLFMQAERLATLEERQRVAAEMHDGLGQTLSYLGLMTDQAMQLVEEGRSSAALQRLNQTRETIEEATREVRRAINNLMSEPASQPDLCSQLHSLVGQFTEQTGLDVDCQVNIGPSDGCSRETIDQVLHITHEALTNSARHAQASHILVRLEASPQSYSIIVQDDGRGFDPVQPGPAGHFGLQVMQARATHIGGKAEVVSSPGQGTRVTLTWPLNGG